MTDAVLYLVHGGPSVPALVDQLTAHGAVEPAAVGAGEVPDLLVDGGPLAERVQGGRPIRMLLAAALHPPVTDDRSASSHPGDGDGGWASLGDRVARHGTAWARFVAAADDTPLHCCVLLDRVAAEPDPARPFVSVEQAAFLAFARHLDRDTGEQVRVSVALIDRRDLTSTGGLRTATLAGALAELTSADPDVGLHLVTLGSAGLQALL